MALRKILILRRLAKRDLEGRATFFQPYGILAQALRCSRPTRLCCAASLAVLHLSSSPRPFFPAIMIVAALVGLAGLTADITASTNLNATAPQPAVLLCRHSG